MMDISVEKKPMNLKIEFEAVDYFWDKLKKSTKLGSGTYGQVFRVCPKNGQVWDEEEKAFKLLKTKGDYVLEISHLSQLLGVRGLLPLNKIFCQGDDIGFLFPIGTNFEEWWKKRKEEHKSVLELMEDILAVSKSLLVTLSDIHERGIVHRDLSPENILFYDWGPCLIDLGYSRHQSDKRDLFTSGYHLTIRQYRAPEILDPDFFEYTSDAALLEKMKLKDSEENSDSDDNDEEGEEDQSNLIKQNLKLIMEDLSEQDFSNSSSSSGSDSLSGDNSGSSNAKPSNSTINWKKIFPGYESHKMEWITVGSCGKKRVRYYNERIDEWSLGTILYYLFFDELLFGGNIYEQWFQHHCFYFNRYGHWLTDKHPDIFSKLTEEEGTDGVHLGKKLNEWFKENKKSLSKDSEKKQFAKYVSSFYLILYCLLDPNPNKRKSAREILIEAFDSACLPKRLFAPELPIRSHSQSEISIKLTKAQTKHILPLITLFYQFCNKEKITGLSYYHTLYLWIEYLHDKELDNSLEIKKSLMICFETICSYRNISIEMVSDFEKKIKKSKEVFWRSKKERNQSWIDLMESRKGNVWVPLEMNSFHSLEIVWNQEREFKLTNTLLFLVQEECRFPSIAEFSKLLSEESESSN